MNGKVRVVNYVAGVSLSEEGDPKPIINHRIEQFWDGQWTELPVYHEEADGTLTEVPQ